MHATGVVCSLITHRNRAYNRNKLKFGHRARASCARKLKSVTLRYQVCTCPLHVSLRVAFIRLRGVDKYLYLCDSRYTQ
jgi:hypothetical protein